MRRKVSIALLGLMAALALGVAAISAASAQGATATEADTVYQQLINRVAELLGKQPAEVRSALTQAGKERIDQAVEDGDLSRDRADRIKERIDETGRLFPIWGGRGPGRGGPRGGVRGEVTAVSGATVTVETRRGETRTVTLDADTEIRDEGEVAQRSAIAVGETIRVIGEADANGVVTADAVLIGEPCGPGFRGGPGGGKERGEEDGGDGGGAEETATPETQ